METIELLFTWGIPLLLLYVLYQNKKELVQLNAVFARLARRYEGSVHRRTWFDYPSLSVDAQGYTFELCSSLAPGGNVWVTRLNLAHFGAVDFELHLQPHSRLEKLASAIGFQDAAIGAAQFNQAFLVKANNAAAASRFMDEQLQRVLLHLAPLKPELTITPSAIVLTTSFLNRGTELRPVAEFGRLLCTRLRNYTKS